MGGIYTDFLKIPPVQNGLSVGLFGGSFNPPHHGHLHVATTALKRLQLDRVWWLVSPGNPLKENAKLPSLETRIRQSRALVHDPNIIVSGFEASFSFRYSVDLVTFLVARFPAVRFVWIMGADNLASFHDWEGWEKIANLVPIAVIDRPGNTLASRSSRMARKFMHVRFDESDARLLKQTKPPAWLFIHAPRSPLSSTILRQNQT